MMHRKFVWFLLCASVVFCQNIEKELVSYAKVLSVRIDNAVNIRDSIHALEQKLIDQFGDQALDQVTLEAIKQEIIRYYREQYQYAVIVEILEQKDPSEGVVFIVSAEETPPSEGEIIFINFQDEQSSAEASQSEAEVLLVNSQDEQGAAEASQSEAEVLLVNFQDEERSEELISYAKILSVRIDSNLSDSTHELEKKLIDQFSDQAINRATLQAIKKEIIRYYNEQHQYAVIVEIPEQEVTSGEVVFSVAPAHIHEIVYKGNKWYSEKRVQKRLKVSPGDAIDENRLLNDVAWMNENPFHYTTVTLSPGPTKGSSDLEINTNDRFPLRVYTGANNTGLESTGTNRIYGGFVWGDAFFVDDLLTYQFTANSNIRRYYAHFASYLSLLPWKHKLSVYGGYAKIHPKITDFRNKGKDAQGSMRYKIPFKPLYTSFNDEFVFGLDYKYITSNLFFVGETTPPERVVNPQVNVSQAMLGYEFEYTLPHHQTTFHIELFGSFAKWLPHQSIAAYSELRAHAKPRYVYSTVALGYIYTFSNKYALSGLFRAQATPNVLIPSQQFSLGGFNTVRGYEENVFISDNGVLANFEVRTRPFTLIKRWNDDLTFIAFMDYGWGYNYRAFDGIKSAAILWGVGPGFRYNIGPYLRVRVDYGFKLHHVSFDDKNAGVLHAGATLSY